MDLSASTFSFLFTDIEGSTRLWEEHPQAMAEALARHDSILRGVIERHGGRVFKTVGDAFCGVFPAASEAVLAALDVQMEIQREAWRETGALRVRIGLHSGEAQQRDDDFFGPTLNRTARIQSVAYGGQVLLSQATVDLALTALPAGAATRDLGSHRLKDLQRPERIHQLTHPELRADFPALRSLDATPNNLPIQTTSFVEREQQLRDIVRHLASDRLVTLLGPGGTGKTRLSLQIGAELLERYPDGVWFVELAPLRDPELVPQQVASVLGVHEAAGHPILRTLVEHLKTRETLLILDNCEHLAASCAATADELLRTCPRLRILASSREALGVPGETVYRVPSLSVPDPDAVRGAGSAATIAEFAAIRLFVDRARSVTPEFTLTDDIAPALCRICACLDGIPLAIELAASRVRVLTVEQIATRLDDRFKLLTGGSRVLMPRQQTLRALIDWSYDLLSEKERGLLARLSVFAGGWTLEAAEKVCADEVLEDWEILDLLTALFDKSLVVRDDDGDRYRLLGTIRQYALEKHSESGDYQPVRARHAAYFLGMALGADQGFGGPKQRQWLQTLEKEHDNLREALESSLSNPDEPCDGVQLAEALWRFWDIRGYLREGRQWLERALSRAPVDTEVRARVLTGAGHLALRQDDLRAARMFAEESLSIRRGLGDGRGVAVALNNLANAVGRQGDFAAARTLHEESLTIGRELGDQRSISGSFNNLGSIAQSQGDYSSARDYYEEALAIYRAIGDGHGAAIALYNLGDLARLQHDIPGAGCCLSECLAISCELGDRYVTACGLEACAAMASVLGDAASAALLWAAADAIRDAIGAPLAEGERASREADIAGARGDLGGEAFESAWSEGRTLSLENAVRFARRAVGMHDGGGEA